MPEPFQAPVWGTSAPTWGSRDSVYCNQCAGVTWVERRQQDDFAECRRRRESRVANRSALPGQVLGHSRADTTAGLRVWRLHEHRQR